MKKMTMAYSVLYYGGPLALAAEVAGVETGSSIKKALREDVEAMGVKWTPTVPKERPSAKWLIERYHEKTEWEPVSVKVLMDAICEARKLRPVFIKEAEGSP